LHIEVPDITPPLRGWLIPQFLRLAAKARVTAGRLHLTIVNDRTMGRLHHRHTGVEGTTDVLTFDLRDNPADPSSAHEADLVICLDEAGRQARQRGHAVRLEVLLYALHGLLHLVGYDDHSPRARAKMHRREDELLMAGGFGPVYARKRRKPRKPQKSP
jgi:probable rRNA maturation factor